MSFKDWVDVVTQIILVILGFGVFWQIKVAKDGLRTSCAREAAAMSVKLAKEFVEETIPQINIFFEKLDLKNFSFMPLAMKDFYMEEVRAFNLMHAKQFEATIGFFKANNDLRNDCIAILNSLEAFAMNFDKGVADEEVAFTALSQVYCNYVECFSPVLCSLRDPKSNFFTNVVSLYKLWSGKMVLKKLTLDKETIVDKFNEQLDKVKSDVKKMTPIGVVKK